MKNNYPTHDSRPICLPKWVWLSFVLLSLFPLCTQAQTIRGTVFRDFNSDGIYTSTPTSGTYAYGEPGVGGVIVSAYNAAGALVSTTTSSTTTSSVGSYTLTVGNTNAHRIEFTVPQSLDFLNEGFRVASGTGTSVQFANGGATGLNFGVSASTDYCQLNPPLAVPCYVSGDPLSATTTVADEVALVSVPYNASGTGIEGTYLASAEQVGSVFGAAFQRETKKLFTAAFLKRHVGLGSAGLGGIYVTNITASQTQNAALYVDLESAPFSVSLGAGLLAGRVLPGSGTVASNDPLAFDAVGKVGLGGMALSTDGRTLYAVDLFNRRLLALAIGNPAKASLTAGDLSFITIPDPGCTNGVARPMAVKVHDGKVYVGVVCTGENGGTASNLFAHIYSMDEGSTTLPTTPTFSFRLNYSKGMVHTQDDELGANWQTWVSQFSGINIGATLNPSADGTVADPFFRRAGRPQAMLSDIAFTDNGDMVIGFMDRAGHQLGYRQRNTTQASSTTLSSGYIGGDILRASFNGSNWVLERNGTVGGLTSLAGVGTGQGPGTPTSTTYTNPSGEFYSTENYRGFLNNDNPDIEIHQETFMGGALILPGTNKAVATVMDPLNTWSGGFSWFDNQTGSDNRRAEIYRTLGGTAAEPSTLGKANGLGLIQALCDPSPIQIGNRVWRDTNNNGVQDAGESALAGVTVTLKGSGLPTNGTTVTTNANGEYYFSNATGTNVTGFVYNLTGLTMGGSYSLTFPTSVSAGTLLLSTKPDQATGVTADAIDTDANASGLISFTLGQSGQNNFTYDAGYATPPCDVSVAVTSAVCLTATNLYVVTGTVSFSNTGGGSFTIVDGTASTIVSATGTSPVGFTLTGASLVSNQSSHTVTATASSSTCEVSSATYAAPASCQPRLSVIVATPVCNSATNTYTATGTVSLTNSPAGSLTITDNGTTIGVISVTAGQTTASFSVSGISNASSHTVIATLTGGTSASVVYAAPAACTVCSTSITTTSVQNGQVGTPYSQTVTASDGTAPYSYTLLGTLPAGLNLSLDGVISGTPTTAATNSFTIKVTDSKSCSDTQPLTIIIADLPVCSLTATATPGSCNSATNAYSVTGTVTSTNAAVNNASPQTLTVSVGSISTVVILTGNGPVSYTLAGLVSDGLTKTVSVLSSATACGTTTVTYSAPSACTVCTLSLTTTTLPKGEVDKAYSQTVVATGGTTPYSFSTAPGTLPTGLTLNPTTGVVSGTPTTSGTFPTTVVVTDAQGCVVRLPLSVFQIDPNSTPVMNIVVNAPVCNSATNTYTATGTVSLTNSPAGSLTITDNGNTVAVVTVTAGQPSASFSLTGISNGPATHLVSAALGTLSAGTTYTEPESCTSGAPAYAIAKTVDLSRTVKGGIVTYTVSLTNTGNATGTNLVITDQLSNTAVTFIGSATASVGTFLPGANSGSWSIASLGAGQVATLRVNVQLNQEGITYNTVTAPNGTTVAVCTTVPYKVCANEAFEFTLSTDPGQASYQWNKDGQPIAGATTNTLSVTALGEYTVSATTSGSCPNGSCCPFVIEAYGPLPSLTAVAAAASCNGATPLNDAKITLVGTSANAVSYNITMGSSFTAAAPLFASNQSLTTISGGVLAANLANPASAPGDVYTIRVYTADGCFADTTVTIPPAVCQCPPPVCVPLTVRKLR
ncbi:putative Ig domain-containing protein [Fibrella aquatica]|uniref:putative Ig domain-containing protein n=1 Tax=Fibrella aquatica TaxID=3242487 RepID=UPI0035202651